MRSVRKSVSTLRTNNTKQPVIGQGEIRDEINAGCTDW